MGYSLKSLSFFVFSASLVLGAAAQPVPAAEAASAARAAAEEALVEVARAEGHLVPLEDWQVVLVTAKQVPRLGDVRQISNAFTFEGRVYAHATLTAEPGRHGGRPELEVRWFNADRLVSRQSKRMLVTKSPFYLASSTSGTALGPGICRVELHVNGKLIATREFEVAPMP